MDLRRHLLDLFGAPVGDEILPGVRLIGASTELGLRATVEWRQREVHIEVVPASEGGRYAARSGHFLFSYRAGGGEGQLDQAAAKGLCEELAAVAARNEAAVLKRLVEEARAARVTEHDQTRIREVRVERLVELAHADTTRYYTLSPYVGCLIGCRFCYAQERLDMVRRMAGLPEVPWGSWVDVRINAPEVLAKELSTLTPRAIKFCPIVSDPYQAVETRYKLTRQCLEVLQDAPDWPVLILSRSHLIERDAELIAGLSKGCGGASIPTIDDTVRAHFEPRGSPIPKRLKALKNLKAAGANTMAVVQPMLPGDLDALADGLAEGANSVSIDVLRGEYGAVEDFDDPRYAFCRDRNWQRDRAAALSEALEARGVEVWHGELPGWAI